MSISTNRKYTKRKPGDVVGNALLIERVNNRLWKMKCKCGNIFVAQPSSTKGNCRKCGYDKLSVLRTIHGESPKQNKKNASRLYGIWLGMKTRCSNPTHHDYHYYGERGVSVCEEWANNYLSFKHWAIDNGYDDSLTIDRIDVNGNYEPSNCRWVTMCEQSQNKRNRGQQGC